MSVGMRGAGAQEMRVAMRLALATWLAIASVWPAAALANDTAMGSVSGTPAPRAVTDVRMEAETIQCTVFPRFAEYRVDFEFVNEGSSAVDLTLGFPFLLPYEDTPGYMPAGGFRAWQDGAPLEVGYVEGTDGPRKVGYYTHEVTFAPGANRVTVSYLASPSHTVATMVEQTPPAPWGSVELHSQRALTYWVHTGAPWAGTIGRTFLRYRFSPDALAWGTAGILAERVRYTQQSEADRAAVLAAVRTPDPRTFEWEFVDYEPTPDTDEAGLSIYDITLPYFEPALDVQGTGGFLYPPGSASASSELTLDAYTYPARQAFDGRPDTAWAEAVDGSGSGEHLDVEFAEATTVSEIRVISGYAKTPTLFAKYNRPRNLRIEFDDGSSEVLRLEDHPGLQRFAIPTRKVSSAGVWIDGVYRGTTRDETYLTEVQFGASVGPGFDSFETLMGRKTQPSVIETRAVEVTPVANIAPLSPISGEEPPAGDVSPWVPVGGAALAVSALVAAGVVIARRRAVGAGSVATGDEQAATGVAVSGDADRDETGLSESAASEPLPQS